MSTSTAKKSSRRTSSSQSRSRPDSAPDAVQLLTKDHRDVKALFQEYQKLVDHEADDDEKAELAQQICAMLTVHATVEEEIFYPAAEEGIKDPDLVEEAKVEHATAKDLIAQIEAAAPSDALYDAKVKVLGEYIDHHVKEEEGQLFPQARRAKLDLAALGEQLSMRKQELLSELGLSEEQAA
jgi:hemerythrin superfamily protein